MFWWECLHGMSTSVGMGFAVLWVVKLTALKPTSSQYRSNQFNPFAATSLHYVLLSQVLYFSIRKLLPFPK